MKCPSSIIKSFVQKFRLVSSLIAVEQSSGGLRIISLGPGAVLKTGELDGRSGLIEVVFENRTVSVFVQDLRDRAEQFETITDGPSN